MGYSLPIAKSANSSKEGATIKTQKIPLFFEKKNNSPATLA